MWADLKNYIRQKCPKTQYDLAKCVRKFEKKLTPEYCKKYADHVRNVIQTVIYPVFSLNEYLIYYSKGISSNHREKRRVE